MRLGTVFLLILLLGVSPAASQVAGDKTVVPGTRIGQWTLEMSIQDLMRMNGPPSTRPSVVPTFIPRMVWYSWDPLGVAAGTHDRRKTQYLAIHQTRELVTQRGIGYRSSKKSVLAAYGEPTLEGDIFVQGRIVTVVLYDKIGLAVFLDEDVVQVLLIFRPGEAGDLISMCGG